MFTREFGVTAVSGLILGLFSVASTVFAATDPGAAACQPEQGQMTAAIAQTGQLGAIVSSLAPINGLNQQSLFRCHG
ncbi:MAG: hypothetical protein LC797_23190 [Chloroflexi bacterium]|nr:hypothetical protein [Chloroflexota bacterium]